MLIDWFTVAAQVLNFVILVWLMKRFLYKPVLLALDTREKLIAAQLADAGAKKAEAQKQSDDFGHKNQKFDQQRAALLTKAADEAKAEGQRLLEQARLAADTLGAKRREALRTEVASLDQSVLKRAQQEVFAIARKALTDLAGADLEQRMTGVFAHQLRHLGGKAKSVLAEAIKTSSDPAVLRSAFALPAAQREAIQGALDETFAAKVRVRFETAPELIGGIELSSNGQKLAWSIADYLASLQQGVDDIMRDKAAEAAKPAPQTVAKPDDKADDKAAPPAKAAHAAKVGAKASTKPGGHRTAHKAKSGAKGQ